MTDYSKTSHTVFYHRYHIVWITKYRKRVLQGEARLRIREIIAQGAEDLGVTIVNGVLSADHVHLFVEIPPHVSVSEFVKIAKGRSSRKVQMEFPHLKKVYWGNHFWARGFFSTTSGNVTDEVINNYINNHSDANKTDNERNISLE
jgi:putative transposase